MTLEELKNNEALASEIFKAESLDDLFGLLRANGVDFDETELRDAYAKLGEGELDESSLEDVAGGTAALKTLGAAYWALKNLPKLLKYLKPKFPGIAPRR